MKVEQDVVMDLLPVYFSGEASAATKALVEENFRENPELERMARSANQSLELLKSVDVPRPKWEERLALEQSRRKARSRAEAWYSTSGISALVYTVVVAVFKFQGNTLVFPMWQRNKVVAASFAVTAAIMWLALWLGRPRYTWLSRRFRVRMWASGFSACAILLGVITEINLAIKAPDNISLVCSGLLAVAGLVLWVIYFRQPKEEQS